MTALDYVPGVCVMNAPECSVYCEPEAGRHTIILWTAFTIAQCYEINANRAGRPYRMPEANSHESCAANYGTRYYVHLQFSEAVEAGECPYVVQSQSQRLSAVLTTIQLVNEKGAPCSGN